MQSLKKLITSFTEDGTGSLLSTCSLPRSGRIPSGETLKPMKSMEDRAKLHFDGLRLKFASPKR